MAITTLTLDDLYEEISDLARDQGVATKEQWDEMVEDVVEDHLDLGELDLDQDTEGMKDVLRGRWGSYKKESSSEDTEVEDEPIVDLAPERVEDDLEDDFLGLKDDEI